MILLYCIIIGAVVFTHSSGYCCFYIGAVALTTGFTNGAGQIWLDNVQCRGTETRLIDCPANALGSHNCAHVEDAGVRCPTGEFIK